MDLRLDGASIKRSTTEGPIGTLPRLTNLSIAGPFGATGAGDSPSRRRLFVSRGGTPVAFPKEYIKPVAAH